MKLSRFLPMVAVALTVGCDGEPMDAPDAQSFRAAATLEMGPPSALSPFVATLTPGAPFEIGHRYGFVKAPGAGPDMSRFSPENIDDVPHLRSGDIVRVKRNGKLSRARIAGLNEAGEIVFVSQAQSPFVHSFAEIPWSAWGAHGPAMAQFSNDLGKEWLSCVGTVGESPWCADAADDELDDAASGIDGSIKPDFGGVLHVGFECLIPSPHSMTVIDYQLEVGGCDGSFSGTLTYESTFDGCELLADGTWTASDPDCWDGPGDTIVIDTGKLPM